MWSMLKERVKGQTPLTRGDNNLMMKSEWFAGTLMDCIFCIMYVLHPSRTYFVHMERCCYTILLLKLVSCQKLQLRWTMWTFFKWSGPMTINWKYSYSVSKQIYITYLEFFFLRYYFNKLQSWTIWKFKHITKY